MLTLIALDKIRADLAPNLVEIDEICRLIEEGGEDFMTWRANDPMADDAEDLRKVNGEKFQESAKFVKSLAGGRHYADAVMEMDNAPNFILRMESDRAKWLRAWCSTAANKSDSTAREQSAIRIRGHVETSTKLLDSYESAIRAAL